MSTYVISDIHGCYSEFQQMLDKIQFNNETDELIIAGDIIDRGNENFQMLKYLESNPKNITFLMGNHDYDFVYYCKALNELYEIGKLKCDLKDIFENDNYKHIYDVNVIDKYHTVEKLINQGATLSDFKKWAKLISNLKYTTNRTINNKKYIVVHAGFIHQKDLDKAKKEYRVWGYNDIKTFYIWAREEGVIIGGENNATIIFGHTPTISNTYFFNDGKVFIEEKKNRRFIDIDCGYVWKNDKDVKNANFACIRLEDEEIFYLI